MFDVVLYEPEIPPNTGNIMRLCANTGCRLHLIQPLGFSIDDKQLRRAGLDYSEYASVSLHENLASLTEQLDPTRIFAITTKGSKHYDEVSYKRDDVFVFGPETRGLPEELLNPMATDRKLRIPMQENSRSLNLANAVSVVVYEAWRQLEFARGS